MQLSVIATTSAPRHKSMGVDVEIVKLDNRRDEYTHLTFLDVFNRWMMLLLVIW